MFIPDHKIEEVRAASDIVDVVGEYVRLKRNGSRFVGLCPFHNEKTPSFGVTPSLGIYKCFGCGAGGDVIKFIREIESVGFFDAVLALAERAGIQLELQESNSDKSSEAESIYHALRFAARFYYTELTQADGGKAGLEYFKGRGFTKETIKHFGVGYAPDAWDALLVRAGQNQLSPEVLEKAGLVIPRKDGSGYYDRYRDRVIFPILSTAGKVLGFGGRVLRTDPDQPKYINSPETEVYHKSRVLYGLYQGKQAIRKAEEVILVEGYTDVISLHQAGVENAVAVCGTSLTEGHVKGLSRYAKRLVFINDADAAGDNATLRGIGLALRGELAPYVIRLPQGEDPDSFVQKNGGEGFNEYVQKHRSSFVEFMLDQARTAGRLSGDPEREAAVYHEILDVIALIEDPLRRESYVREMGRLTNRPDIQFFEALRRTRSEQKPSENRRSASRPDAAAPSPARQRMGNEGDEDAAASAAPEGKRSPPESALPEEKILIRIMLEHGAPLVEFILGNMGLDEFTEGAARDAVLCFIAQYQQGRIDPAPFMDGTFGEAVSVIATEVSSDQYEPSENWKRKANIPVPRLNEDPSGAAAGAMMLLKLDRVNEAIERERAEQYGLDSDSEAFTASQRRIMDLQALRRRIEQREFLQWNKVE